ncbi:helix-turn-helix domain-containing protein, partial [Photobacterium phosphoreum]|uniref:helix-turn-helix domain-containing protein n=1 Tax=Photobacterium phosphoreum TaxID=659 RepID=UPI001F34CDB3
LIIHSIILDNTLKKECSLHIIKQKVKMYIINGFFNIKESDIISDLNLTYYNINVILKKNKMTWLKLINECKVEILYEKIENKEIEQSLQELCIMSGFINMPSASRLFKLKFGITMKEYIKNNLITTI